MLIRLYRRLAGQYDLEECFYIEPLLALAPYEVKRLMWLITGPDDEVSYDSHLQGHVVEVGPRLSVETPFSSNAVGICQSMGILALRIEKSIRYSAEKLDSVKMDPLTQEIYPEPLTTFGLGCDPEPVMISPVLGWREKALITANIEFGLGMDMKDIEYYTQMFLRLGRNPTDVELFQIGNGNSEHSRHHFFRGIQVIDGVEMPESLMDIVKAPWKVNPGNSLVAFHDNSGVIQGCEVPVLLPSSPGQPSFFYTKRLMLHKTITAETHNHPTLIAPFPGANTGSGGRIRDNRAVGRGGLTHAGLAGYAVGNLHIPDYNIPGETIGGESVASHASPLEILLQGSDGVSDYGNKIGEPLIGGFTRSFGQMVNGARREFRKPVLYSAGVGRLDDRHLHKKSPEHGMHIVRIGGPAYRIGVGGGSASSMIQGTNAAALDLKSVQRGNPEMENRVNRVIQACAEMGDHNPIESIHDQGAGGPSNVLTELMEPTGGRIDIRKITVGDRTMSVLEIWVAEYQEGYGMLILPENLDVFRAICERERVNCEVLGEITDDGNVVLVDSSDDTTPVHLSLASILGDVPRKRFSSERMSSNLPAFSLPSKYRISQLLEMVLKRPEVGSKRYLTTKVDRSVTGLVAQQQCCGPMQVPVADVAVTADGYFSLTGTAMAIGEQPIKMLIDPAAGARMAVAEMLTNLASAGITELSDVKGRANWMVAAKLPGEGAVLYDAAIAMRDIMLQLGIAIDGGKDSLSMATRIGDESIVSPAELVILGYAPVPDITKVVTPDFKGSGVIGFIDLGMGKNRLGGSALAQALKQIGNDAPDIDDPDFLRRAFEAIQRLTKADLITAYHDRSDGGLITALVEMCIAGNCGARVDLPDGEIISQLFSEEAGMVFELLPEHFLNARAVFLEFGIEPNWIGRTYKNYPALDLCQNDSLFQSKQLTTLREWWESTATELELLQANPEMVRQEVESFGQAGAIPYHLSFAPRPTASLQEVRPKVAILREEGTNGDREMAAACMAAGLDPWDITMSDLLSGRVNSLDDFRGLIFPGGFSYADVFGSAKGWAGPILFTQRLRDLFNRFYDRENTFTLGVCNGCQLMANIGWLPFKGIAESHQPRFVHNTSGRFESRWVGVKVLPSPSILLAGMEGSILGIHVAHGEGKLLLPNPQIAEDIRTQQLVPLAYVDVDGNPTEAYPYNPNGSPEGWTALCSPDGRHLAMMPHPERCFLPWQWPWMPEEWRATMKVSPWLQMFQNARTWCLEHQ
jgi:phosphoribosylformylglycinamidine synthase